MNMFIDQISLSKLRAAILLLFAAFCIWPTAVLAEIKSQSDNGFAIFHIADVAAEPDEIWSKLIVPNSWWSENHSWSGDAENLYLEPEIGGCFCEVLKSEDEVREVGAVEHMRIIHIDRGRTLRMTGALGPLQSEAVNGIFTVAIMPNGDGTSKISFLYVIGGYMRFATNDIAPAIDRVIGEQFNNLASLFGTVENPQIGVEKETGLIDNEIGDKESKDGPDAIEKADDKEAENDNEDGDVDATVRKER